MTLLPLHDQHIGAVATLHCACLDGLLTRLGSPVARLFYAGCVEHPLAIGWVAVHGQEVLGFVLGSVRPDQLRADLARRRPLALSVALMIGVLRRPGVLADLSSSRRGGNRDDYDRSAPELIYLAVAPEQRGKQLGDALVHTFTRSMHAAGASFYELSVDEQNGRAIAFYERLGFARVGRYHEFGLHHLRYRLHTGDSSEVAGK